MNTLRRIFAILADPATEWAAIAKEPGDAAYLLTRYVAPLALIPAVFGLIGACVVGAIVPGAGSVRLPPAAGLLGAVMPTSCRAPPSFAWGYWPGCWRRRLVGRAISTPPSNSQRTRTRRSGLPEFFCWRRDCDFSSSPAFTAHIFYGSVRRLWPRCLRKKSRLSPRSWLFVRACWF